MERIRVWILLGRIAQILLAMALAGFSFAVSESVYMNYNVGVIVSGALGTAMVLFGFIGLFDLRTFKSEKSRNKAFWLILTLDCLSILFGIGGSTTIAVGVDWYWWVDKATLVTPVVCGYLCSLLLVPFVIRSIRTWRKQSSSPIQDYLHEPEKQLCARCHADIHGVPEYYHMQPVYQAEPVGAGYYVQDDKKSPSPRARSFDTTARWSGVSGAATLAYPNIASMTGPPTRVPSEKAPSYMSR